MSIRVMTAVWDSANVKNTQLLLLLAIADNANDDGIAWPGVNYLAVKTRKTERAVVDMVKELVDAGELGQVTTEDGKPAYLVTCYARLLAATQPPQNARKMRAKPAQNARKIRAKCAENAGAYNNVLEPSEPSEPPKPSEPSKPLVAKPMRTPERDFLDLARETAVYQAQGKNVSVPTTAGGTDPELEDLVDIFADYLHTARLPPSIRKSWVEAFKNIIDLWQAPMDIAKAALIALLDPSGEMAWKHYTSPMQASFATDYGVYIGRQTQVRSAGIIVSVDPGGVIRNG